MPKSKNRRKSKSSSDNGAGAQTIVEAQAAAGGEKASASGAAEAVKKPSVGPIQFYREVRNEVRKVTWTGRQEVMISTIMVMIMVAIMCLFFFLVDQGLRIIMPLILSLNLFS